MYFAGNEYNAADGLYTAVPEELRPMLTVAFDETTADGVPQGVFDLHVETGMELPI